MWKLRTVDYIQEAVPQLPDRLLPFMWYFARQMKWQLAAMLFLFGVSNVLIATKPYFFKLFVEVFEETSDPAQIWVSIAGVLGAFVGLLLIVQPLMAQAGNWLQARTLPVFANMTRRQLALYMHHHSYEYFQNDFAGRLAGKVVETPMAMNDVAYTMVGAVWYALVYFAVAVILFVLAHWSFAAVMLGWLAVYGVILFFCFSSSPACRSAITRRHRSAVLCAGALSIR